MLNWIVLNRTDYLHKMDLALNNLQMLICHKTKPNLNKNLFIYSFYFIIFIFWIFIYFIDSYFYLIIYFWRFKEI